MSSSINWEQLLSTVTGLLSKGIVGWVIAALLIVGTLVIAYITKRQESNRRLEKDKQDSVQHSNQAATDDASKTEAGRSEGDAFLNQPQQELPEIKPKVKKPSKVISKKRNKK